MNGNRASLDQADILIIHLTEAGEKCSSILRRQISDLQQRLPSKLPGHLTKARINGYIRWFHVLSSDESSAGKKEKIYLSQKDNTLLRHLASQLYCNCALKVKKNQLAATELFLKKLARTEKYSLRIMHDPDLLCLLNHPDPMQNALIKWQNADYPKNNKHPEALRIKAAGGHLVRSKSEAMIVASLVSNNIPFRYECGLSLSGATVYPDFIILHPMTGKLFIWEHFGMMDDKEYAANAARKIHAYIQNGYIPAINFIMTSETKDHPLDYQKVELTIQEYFMLS